MSRIAARLKSLGLVLPEPMQIPGGVTLPFPWVSVRGDRVFISGHGPLEADGSIATPLGKVGREVTPEQAAELAGKVGLAILASVQREIGDLDRVTGWGKIFGMVNSAPGFNRQPDVINGFSDVILKVFGNDVGRHARSAVGMAELPFDIAVEIEGELTITT